MLDRIVADKKKEVELRKGQMPVSFLMKRIAEQKMPLDFARAIRGEGVKLIAEVKKASPSKGVLCPDYDPVGLAKTYAEWGAAAISVLTESNYFQGNIDHLAAIREEVNIPLLRKDFIFDQYQVFESAAYGADALLLIAAILSQDELEVLMALSRSLGIGYLVEVHNEDELKKALICGAEIIGINNRDLKTFSVDINTTRRLRPLIPEDRIVVSESGITCRADMERLRDWRVNAALVGEALLTADDTPARIKELVL